MEEPKTPPTFHEPVVPQEPFARPADHRVPEAVSPTGKPTGAPDDSRSQSGAYLTTAGGVRLPDTDHSFKAGDRGPTLLQDHHLREKITHFDHERIPERVVHARGAGAHGVFEGYGTAAKVTRGQLPGQGGPDPGLRPVLDRVGVTRLGRHRAGHARLRGEILHRRGQLRPRRQQHPGVLHPGRDQVPRRHPRRQAPSRSRDPAGAERPRYLLGLRLAAHRGAAPHDVEHVRPSHPRVLAHDGGVRRPHLPPGRGRRHDDAGEVALEAQGRRPLAGVGRGADGRRAATPTSTVGIWPMPSKPGPSRSGSWASRRSPTPRTRRSRASTCWTRPRSCPRNSRRWSRSAC